MQNLIIDRIEGKYAVCEAEDGHMINIEFTRLPKQAFEGSCIIIDNNGDISLNIDKTKARKELIAKKMHDLFE